MHFSASHPLAKISYFSISSFYGEHCLVSCFLFKCSTAAL